MNYIALAKKSIDDILVSAAKKAAQQGELPEGAELKGIVEIPKDLSNGD
ncbi:MAG: hypothetical protein MJ067_04300 [Oscillospiraceae bacterium]|nr:hypothetical protein [Oscillospiraceae bacterium]